MLKKNPVVGEVVVGLQDDFWPEEGYPFVLKGEIYEIVGIDERSGNPFYVFDDEEIYIDEDAWHLYDLVEGETESLEEERDRYKRALQEILEIEAPECDGYETTVFYIAREALGRSVEEIWIED